MLALKVVLGTFSISPLWHTWPAKILRVTINHESVDRIRGHDRSPVLEKAVLLRDSRGRIVRKVP